MSSVVSPIVGILVIASAAVGTPSVMEGNMVGSWVGAMVSTVIGLPNESDCVSGAEIEEGPAVGVSVGGDEGDKVGTGVSA